MRFGTTGKHHTMILKKLGSLFSEYISTFQGYKQEASGFPEHIDEYIKKYQEREGVTLRKENIKYNSGLRSLEKLKLNNLWGKFAQNTNFPKVWYVDSADEYFAILTSKALEVTHIDLASQNRVQIQYKMEKDFVTSSAFTNVVIATFTTAHARSKLYSYLEKLQEQVLYFDTDSVIFKHSYGMYCPPVGDYLGDLTSELGPGEIITTFCSTGPKSYAYTTNMGNKVCKVKGITLNFRNSVIMNEQTMFKIVYDVIQDVHVVYPHMINEVKKDWAIDNVSRKKVFRKVYEKQKVLPNLHTLPWGYKV